MMKAPLKLYLLLLLAGGLAPGSLFAQGLQSLPSQAGKDQIASRQAESLLQAVDQGPSGRNYTLAARIDGPDGACPYDTYCWDAILFGTSPGPYTYEWAYSTNGFLYTNFAYSAIGCLSFFQFTPPQTITLRLKVTSPYTFPAYAYKTIELIDIGGQITCFLKNSPVGNMPNQHPESPRLEVSPNPADLEAQVHLSLTENLPSQVKLFSLTGQQVLAINPGELQSGQHHFELPTLTLPNGIYLVQATIGEQRLTQRLVIAH